MTPEALALIAASAATGSALTVAGFVAGEAVRQWRYRERTRRRRASLTPPGDGRVLADHRPTKHQ